MWKEKYEALEVEHKKLIEAHDALALQVRNLLGRIDESERAGETVLFTKSSSGAPGVAADRGENGAVKSNTAAPEGKPGVADAKCSLGTAALVPFDGRPARYDLNFIYEEIKHRAQKDPGILELLTRHPELRVKVERQIITADAGTLRGALALLIKNKFFDSPQNGNTAFNELKRLGRAVAKPNVYRELDKLAELGFVTKEDTGYQAVPRMEVYIEQTVVKGAAAR